MQLGGAGGLLLLQRLVPVGGGKAGGFARLHAGQAGEDFLKVVSRKWGQ